MLRVAFSQYSAITHKGGGSKITSHPKRDTRVVEISTPHDGARPLPLFLAGKSGKTMQLPPPKLKAQMVISCWSKYCSRGAIQILHTTSGYKRSNNLQWPHHFKVDTVTPAVCRTRSERPVESEHLWPVTPTPLKFKLGLDDPVEDTATPTLTLSDVGETGRQWSICRMYGKALPGSLMNFILCTHQLLIVCLIPQLWWVSGWIYHLFCAYACWRVLACVCAKKMEEITHKKVKVWQKVCFFWWSVYPPVEKHELGHKHVS